MYPDVVEAQKKASTQFQDARKKNPMEKVRVTHVHSQGMTDVRQFDLVSITDKLASMEDEEDVPKIKLGDASCAAPFTSKLSNVSASEWITCLVFGDVAPDIAQSPTSYVKAVVLL